MQEPLQRTRIAASTAALESAVSYVDAGGAFLYRGYPVAELAGSVTYEDAAVLLWSGELPAAGERADLLRTIQRGAAGAAAVATRLAGLQADGSPWARLIAAVAMLPIELPELANSASAAGPEQAGVLLGAVASLAGSAASGFAAAADAERTAGLFEGGVAAGFLALARGRAAPPADVQALDQVLIVLAEHELNSSTFAARVAASTRASLAACVVGALCSLSGPLHGGVERYVRVLLAEAERDGAETVIERYVQAGRPIAGFGHAVYRNGDPRAAVMRSLAEKLAGSPGAKGLYERTRELEEVAGWRRLPLANVDLYTHAVYRALGLPDELSSNVFAAARVAGWCAHILEQYQNNRLIRPRAEYTGPPPRHLVAGD